MKQIAFSLIALALVATMQVKAENTDISTIDNVVYMEPATFPAGSQQTLSVKMKNNVGIQTVQFDMVLPEGVTIVKDEEGFELISLSTARTTVRKMDSFSAAFISGTRYRVLINSNNGYTFDGTDGEIVQVVVNIDASVANSTLPFVFEGIVLVDTSSNGFETERVETTLTIAEAQDNRVILDENSTTAPEASGGEVGILVKRTIKAGEWSTICLPFDMTEAQVYEVFGDDVRLAEFTDYETEYDNDNIVSLTVNFDETDLSEGFYGNYPYLIKTTKDIAEFEVTSEIAPDEENAVAEYDNGRTGKNRKVYGSFIGTYHAGDVVPANCLFLSNNNFYYSTGKTSLKAFRGYFQFVDVLASVEDIAGVKFYFFLEDTITAIDEMSECKSSNGNCYDLSGRKVAKPIQRGVYIVNGKKIAVK